MKLAPTVVIAGGHVTGRDTLVQALLGGRGITAADRLSAPDALVVYRHAARHRAMAYIPGFREPRPVALDGDRQAYEGQGPLAICARPPRRLGICLPAALLRHLTLVDTPVAVPVDEAYAAVVARVAIRAVVVYVVDARRSLRAAEVDLLSTLHAQGSAVVFATYGGGLDPVRHRVPTALYEAPCFAADEPAGHAALRATIVEFAAARRTLRPAVPVVRPAVGAVPAARSGGATAPKVVQPGGATAPKVVQPGGGTASEDWRVALDTAVSRCRLAVVRRLASELAAAQRRCQQRLAIDPAGTRRLPDELDRQLQALSIRVTADLDARCSTLAERAVYDLLGRVPRPRVWRRLAAEVRSTSPDQPERVLLVTSDAMVTTLNGTGSLAGLCADPSDANAPLVRPVEVAVTAGGYLMWRRRGRAASVEEATAWLRRSLDSVAAELLVEVDTRCAEVHRTLTRLAGELWDVPGRSLSFAE